MKIIKGNINMTKELNYELTLQRVINWLDRQGSSNTKIRRVVDMVLNHDASFDRAVFIANREADVNDQVARKEI
jgi:hypothetical protein